MPRKTRICSGLMLAFGGGLSLGVSPAFGQQQLERIEVTGSSIKRVQAEGPAPVETYVRKEIERTGATTLNELLRSIATIDIYDQGELASNSPTVSGSANIALRGLDSTNLLVLLNGRRLPINALYDSTGTGAAVDINMIPISAIERVEILKDGASAVYGADAVAGVINFITRKDYQGIELTVGVGGATAGDAKEHKAGLTGGWGNLEKDSFNVLAGVNLYKRDPIYRKDREISRSSDFRRFDGPDARSSFSPFGNLVDADFNFTGATVRPCPPELFSGGRCRYDFNADLLTAYNGADRVSGMVLGSLKVTNSITAFGELLLAQTKDHFDGHPAPDIFVAPSGEFFFGRFMQGGPRMTDRKSDLSQLSVGLEGALGPIEWKVDAGQGRSKVVNRDTNYFDATLYNAATGSGAIDPTVTTNDPALVESLKVRPLRVGDSKITFVNGKVTGELMPLPGGALGYAVGASVWRDSLSDMPDALTQAGEVVGSIQQAAVNASRKAYAVFGELAVPITKDFEGQVAVRHDHYPTATRTSPKIAARYVFNPAFSVRASYAQSFRMPSLKQLFGAREEAAADFTSDALCAALGQPAGCALPGFQVNGSNPNLKPEKGKTFNLGVVVEPTPGLSAAVDYWRIKVSDGIDTPTIDQAVAAGNFGRDPSGRLTVTTALQNFAQIKTEGVDLDLRWRLPKLAIGDLTLRNNTTYYLHKQKTGESGGLDEFNATYPTGSTGGPRWRNVLSVGVDYGPWQGTIAVRSIGGFYDTDEPNPDLATTRKVGAYEEVDVMASFTGIEALKIDLGIKNLLNRMPPVSFQNAVSNQYTGMGFAELYSSRGRFVFANLTYQFK